MKRIIALFMAAFMVLFMAPETVQAATENVTLTVKADKATMAPGDTVNFEVAIGAVESLGVLEFTLNIPSGLTISESSVAIPEGLGTVLDSDGEIIKPASINGYKWSYSAQSTGYKGTSDLTILTFACIVDENATLESKNVTIDVATCCDNINIEEHNVNVVPVAITVEQGVVTCEHSLEKTEAKAPTCIVAGNIEYYTCTKCNKIFSDAEGTVEVTTIEVAPTGKHTEEIRNAVEATEEATGYTGDTYCSVCDQKLAEGTVIEKLAHTHNMKHIEAVEATCVKAGNIEYYTCTKCNKMYSDAEGTVEVTTTEVAPTGKHTEEIRNAVEATEEATGYTGDTYCTVCEQKLADGKVIEKLDHTHSMKHTEAVVATCEKAGNIEYYTCTKCNKMYTDEAGTKEVTDISVKATGHSYDNDADAKCNVCDYQRFYIITSGANSTYTKNTDEVISVTADGAFKLFKAVKVDDVVVDANNYSVSEGSTVVTFAKAYLNGLSSVSHSLEIVFSDDKSAKTQFTIKDAVTDNTGSNNNTGNNDNTSNNDAGNNNNNNSGNTNDNTNSTTDNNNGSINEEVKEPVVENTEVTTPASPKTGEQNGMYVIMICMLVFAGLGGTLMVKKIKK